MPIWGEVELLCRAVEEEARREAEKILSRAGEEEERILADAEVRAEKEYVEESLAQRSKAYSEAKHMVDSAELTARKRIMTFRDQVIRDVLNALEERLKELRNEPSYAEFLASAIKEGIEQLVGQEFILELNEEDLESQKERIAELATEMSVHIDVKHSTSFEGGVRILTADQRLLYDNSLSARLKRSEDHIRQEIWRAIFGTERKTG